MGVLGVGLVGVSGRGCVAGVGLGVVVVPLGAASLAVSALFEVPAVRVTVVIPKLLAVLDLILILARLVSTIEVRPSTLVLIIAIKLTLPSLSLLLILLILLILLTLLILPIALPSDRALIEHPRSRFRHTIETPLRISLPPSEIGT